MPNSPLKSSYPFGSVMPGRSWSEPSLTATYKMGFNGMDEVDEIEGDGNALDFGARIYDSRLGRWLSLDPLMKKYPSLSPYCFTNNNPIIYKDLGGKNYILVIDHEAKTITVVAYYKLVKDGTKEQNTADEEALKQAVKHYNTTNNLAFQFEVKDGDKVLSTESYDLKYDLKIVDENSKSDKYYNENIVNKVKSTTKLEIKNKIKEAEGPSDNMEDDLPTVNGQYAAGMTCQNAVLVDEAETSKAASTDQTSNVLVHELGHTLGMDEAENGNMKLTSNGYTKIVPEIPSSAIEIITNASITRGKNYAGCLGVCKSESVVIPKTTAAEQRMANFDKYKSTGKVVVKPAEPTKQ